jgi:hypothetical protein
MASKSKWRAGLFTFNGTRDFEIAHDEMPAVLQSLGLASVDELDRLAAIVSGGARDEFTEAGYAQLDQKLLPKLDLNLMFANLEQRPELFRDIKDQTFNLTNPCEALKSARIIYFGAWEPNHPKNAKLVQIGLEVSFEFDVAAQADFDDYDNNTESMVIKLQDISSIFSFSLSCDYQYDDDENVWCSWQVHFD